MSKDIAPINEKDQRHGYWEVYWGETNDFGLIYRCFYHNDKEVGYSEWNSTRGTQKKYHI